jgi:hypothetical protein
MERNQDDGLDLVSNMMNLALPPELKHFIKAKIWGGLMENKKKKR